MRGGSGLVAAAFLLLALPSAAADPPEAASTGSSGQDLAAAAANPNAPLRQFQLRDVIAPRLPEFDGTGNVLEAVAVLPLKPMRVLAFASIMKITMPLVTLPDPVEKTGIGDLEVFHQAVFKETWGSWAMGVSVSLPTANDKDLGAQAWVLGPATAIMYTGVDDLVAGAVLEYGGSVYNSSPRQDVSTLTITPTLTYNLPRGWFVGYSDFDLVYDFGNDGGATIPIGLQVGRIIEIGEQPFSLSVEAGYNVVRPDHGPTPRCLIGIELTALFPVK